MKISFDFTWNIPINTAMVVREYRDNSVREATLIAILWRWSSSESISTKNTTKAMMVATITKIPKNKPVFACVQSTLHSREIIDKLFRGYRNLEIHSWLLVIKFSIIYSKWQLTCNAVLSDVFRHLMPNLGRKV